MLSKRQKRIKKIQKSKVSHKLGHLYMVNNELHVVKYLNAGGAWLAPHRDDIAHARYSCCLDVMIDEYARLRDGTRVYRATEADVTQAELLGHRDEAWLEKRSYAV